MNHPNQTNAWTRYVPPGEPAEVTESWDAAAAALARAALADWGHRTKARDAAMREVYGHLKTLRGFSLGIGTGWNARPGSPSSRLMIYGEKHAARVNRSQATG